MSKTISAQASNPMQLLYNTIQLYNIMELALYHCIMETRASSMHVCDKEIHVCSGLYNSPRNSKIATIKGFFLIALNEAMEERKGNTKHIQ